MIWALSLRRSGSAGCRARCGSPRRARPAASGSRLDRQRRLERVVEQVHDVAPPLLVELERDAADDRLGMVEAARLARGARRLEQLRERAAQRLAPERRRQAGPLLVVEPGLRGGPVVVLERAAALLGAHELDAVELTQDAHVVGNVPQRVAELAREVVRALHPTLVEALQDPLAKRVRERLREALVQLAVCRRD